MCLKYFELELLSNAQAIENMESLMDGLKAFALM